MEQPVAGVEEKSDRLSGGVSVIGSINTKGHGNFILQVGVTGKR